MIFISTSFVFKSFWFLSLVNMIEDLTVRLEKVFAWLMRMRENINQCPTEKRVCLKVHTA